MSNTLVFTDLTELKPGDLRRSLHDTNTGTYRGPSPIDETREFYRHAYLLLPGSREADYEAAWPNLWALQRAEWANQHYIMAIVDTGLMHEHPLLQGCIEPEEADFTGEGTEDYSGHGTLVALIARMTSFAPMRFVNVKVMPGTEIGNKESLIQGLNWLLAYKQRLQPDETLIANISCGIYSTRFGMLPCQGTCKVCRTASEVAAQGITLCVAAGNQRGKTACPAVAGLRGRSPGIISLGAAGYGTGAVMAPAGGRVNFAGARLVPSSESDDEVYSYLQRGQALLDEGKYAEALPLYERVTTIEPLYVYGWSKLGYTLAELGRFDESLTAINRAISLDDNSVGDWTNRSWALIEQGRLEEGLAAAERALTLDPERVMAWVNKSWALSRLHRPEEVIPAAERALELDPVNQHALNNLAWTLYVLGRHTETLDVLERAISVQPDSALLWARKGAILKLLGRNDDALAAVQRAMDLKPTTANVLLSVATTLTDLEPTTAGVWLSVATTLTDLKRYDEALDAFNRAIEIAPQSSSVRYARARMWVARGLPAAAAGDTVVAKQLEEREHRTTDS